MVDMHSCKYCKFNNHGSCSCFGRQQALGLGYINDNSEVKNCGYVLIVSGEEQKFDDLIEVKKFNLIWEPVGEMALLI